MKHNLRIWLGINAQLNQVNRSAQVSIDNTKPGKTCLSLGFRLYHDRRHYGGGKCGSHPRSPNLSEPKETPSSAEILSGSQVGRAYMSDSMHFRVFACCKRFDRTVRESGKANGSCRNEFPFPTVVHIPRKQPRRIQGTEPRV